MWRPPWRWFERLAVLRRLSYDVRALLDLMSPTRKWLTPWRGVPASVKRTKVRDWLRSSDLGVDLVAVLRRLSYDDMALLDLMSPTRRWLTPWRGVSASAKGRIWGTGFFPVTSELIWVSWIVALVVVSVAFDSLLEGFLNVIPPTGFDHVTFRLWGDNHQSFGLFKVILNDRRCCRCSAAELQGLLFMSWINFWMHP